jgi:hypothetical protein
MLTGKRLLWVIVSLLFVAIMSVAHLPAAWIFTKVQQQVPQLSVNNTSGFLWHGSASDAEFTQRGYPLPLGNIQWHMDWMSFIFFKPCLIFTIDSEMSQVKGHLCIHPISQKIIIYQLQGQIPVTGIAEMFGVAIGGNVQMMLDRFILEDKQLSWVRGDLFWKSARFYNGEKWLDLGDILIALDGQSETKSISAHWLDMTNEQGFSPLDIDVDMQFLHGRLVSIQGSLKPLHTTDATLQQTLELVTQYKEGRTFFIEQQFPSWAR